MKKFILSLICISFIIGGCQKAPVKPDEPVTPSVAFDDLVDELTMTILNGTSHFDLNYIANDIDAITTMTDMPYGLGIPSLEDYNEQMAAYEKAQIALRKIDYASLDSTQKVVYEAITDYLKRQLVLKDFYYEQQDFLASYSSPLTELPLMLEMYTFNSLSDIDGLLLDIAHFKDDFHQIYDLEVTRQEKGIGFCEPILIKTKDQLKAIIDEGGKEVLEVLYQNIDACEMDGLDKEATKAAYKKAIEEDFIGAYQYLYDLVQDLHGPEALETNYSKAYYEAQVYNQLGISSSKKVMESQILAWLDESSDEMYRIMSQYPRLYQEEDFYGLYYDEFTTPEEGLDFLSEHIFTLVPEIDNLKYNVLIVPESLRDGFAPAAYLTSKIDQLPDQPESIMINPDDVDGNAFPTLAHEGYPGHMYQSAYLNTLNYPAIMRLCDCIGYVEGWAVYAEQKVYGMLLDDYKAAWQRVVDLNDTVAYDVFSIIEMNIYEENWTLEDAADFYGQYFGGGASDIENFYTILIQSPGYTLHYYYTAQMLNDMHQNAKDQLGSDFNEVAFNEVILNSGTVGMDVVLKNVNRYIKSK